MDDQFEPREKVDLALVRAEHQKRYQVMIEYIKEKIGDGIEYRNSVARVVVSEKGAYYELLDLPEEFSGAVGDQVQRLFVAPSDVIALLTRAVEALPRANAENTRHCSLLILYTRRGLVDRKNCYIYEYQPREETPGHTPLEIGKFQPGVMPLFYKIKMDADFTEDVLGMARGMVFGMASAGDRHLLVRVPYSGDQVVDLGDLPNSKTIH